MKGKRSREIAKLFEPQKLYTLEEAIAILQKCPPVKFEQTVEVALKTGIDPQKSDQQVRGVVALPNGTGKKVVVAVFAKGDKAREAEEAGADFVGSDDLFEKIKGGWVGFDVLIATPDMMREVGKLGKILGPRNLMPSPKAETVTTEVGLAVKSVKAGKIEFKSDKHGVISAGIGKLTVKGDKLVENIQALIAAIAKAKPATSKGKYLQSLVISSTMGPGLRIALDYSVEA